MKKILTILLLAMLVASMPIAMAESQTENVTVFVKNGTLTVIDPDGVSPITTTVDGVFIIPVPYTCPDCVCPNINQTALLNAIKSEMAAQNYTVVWNETTFREIVNNEVQAARADEQAWIEHTWMKTQQDYENVTAERDEWKLEAARLQTELNQYTGPNSIPTQLENKISDLEKTLWAAGIFILVLCIALVYFILMVVKPGMGRLLKKGGDN